MLRHMNVGELGKFWCLHDMVYMDWMWLVWCCAQFNLSCKTLEQFNGGFNSLTSESSSLGVFNFVYDHVRLNCMFFMLHVGSFGLSSLHGPMDNDLNFSIWEVPLARKLTNIQTLVAKTWPTWKKKGSN
jgi:hypothetical protein